LGASPQGRKSAPELTTRKICAVARVGGPPGAGQVPRQSTGSRESIREMLLKEEGKTGSGVKEGWPRVCVGEGRKMSGKKRGGMEYIG